ncbi:MAG: UDP-N-acetylglucosamine 2-epimerase (non-hydrolyzing) [Actinomycetia bacterium]|nr:UDP-N-acetylglucosamine 2-epimerase (non-hydrolyzing) [Actinomycetes bacterium]
MRVIVVAGARPNFIKIAPLVPACKAAGIQADVVHTGQHYDAMMSDVFFDDLQIETPKWSLGVGSGTHGEQTGKALMRLEELFIAERPDAVLVVGDVNSTLAGALAAVKLGLPVIHLEAGLRSRDPRMPEEINRLLTDQISSLLLTPTRDAGANLEREGISPRHIIFVGNIMAESLLRNKEKARQRSVCLRYGFVPGSFLLATCHRPENTDDPQALGEIIGALDIAPLPVLLLVHPRTRKALAQQGFGPLQSNITFADPVGYLDMLSLQHDAKAIVTDSGGVQEESCLLGTPCVTVRRNTEREITIALGANRLVQADRGAIARGITLALAAPLGWEVPEYWDDQVAARVVAVLKYAEENGFPPFEG